MRTAWARKARLRRASNTGDLALCPGRLDFRRKGKEELCTDDDREDRQALQDGDELFWNHGVDRQTPVFEAAEEEGRRDDRQRVVPRHQGDGDPEKSGAVGEAHFVVV